MKQKVLKDKTINELRAEARNKGIPLLRSMKKQDILRALEKSKKPRKASPGKAALGSPPAKGGKTKKPKTTRRTSKAIARAGKSETATTKKSRLSASSGISGKTAVERKTGSRAALPAGKGKVPDPSVQTAAVKGNALLTLPQEYGENDLFLIVVDPDVVYASWEIRREDLPGRQALTLRLFDVTESGPAGRPERVIDLDIPGRVGSGFFTIRMRGRDIIAEMGLGRAGRFRPLLRSNMVSFPSAGYYHEPGVPEEPEGGPPIGY
jgi:hypothetical protein